MKNDRKITGEVKAIENLAEEYLRCPNPCAYTDSILDKIIERAERLKSLHDSNAP